MSDPWMQRKLYDAIRHMPPPPCDGCRLSQRCKDNRLACRAFNKHVSIKEKSYKYSMSIPSRKIYNKIFHPCDKCKPLTCDDCKVEA